MLRIHVDGVESYDEKKEEFVELDGFDLEFEHSLASLSKWEAHYEKPFYGKYEKSTEEVYFYIEQMLLTKNPPENYLKKLSQKNFNDITNYLGSKQTATTFREEVKSASKETITAELIYFWMVSASIPFECETWNLSRLLTLIRVYNIKNTPPKKRSASELAARNRELNAQRRKELGTSG